MAKFYSTKTYGNDKGLSCCFRQWGATHSHCSLLHGYSIGIKIVFECEALDQRNWVMDFGGLKEFKIWLDFMFDHTLLVAKDDPKLEILKKLDIKEEYFGPSGIGPGQFKKTNKLANLRIVEGVGCEKFAEMIYQELESFISKWKDDGTLLNETVKVTSVEVFEHAGNSAIYQA